MKKILPLLGIFMVLGAGCFSSTARTPESASIVTPAPSASSTPPTPTPAPEATPTPAPDVVKPPLSTPPVSILEPLSVSMKAGNFFFDPANITASPGQKVTITFSDAEGSHMFDLDELNIHKTITSGTVVTFTAPTTAGSYAYYCSIGAHRKLGMEGTLIVK